MGLAVVAGHTNGHHASVSFMRSGHPRNSWSDGVAVRPSRAHKNGHHDYAKIPRPGCPEILGIVDLQSVLAGHPNFVRRTYGPDSKLPGIKIARLQIFPEQNYDDSKLNEAIFQPRLHLSRNKNRATPDFPGTKLRRLQIKQGDLSAPTPLFLE